MGLLNLNYVKNNFNALLQAKDFSSFSKALIIKLEDLMLGNNFKNKKFFGKNKWGICNFERSFYLDDDVFTSYAEIFGGKVYTAHPEFVPQEKDIILDLGANQGIYTILAAKNTVNGKVISVEPDPDNIKWLRENIALIIWLMFW